MSEQARGILQAVGRRLDDTRDLLDAAMEQATALERSLRDHEDTVNDLRWDAAKILLDPNSSRSTLRAVQAGAQQLTEQLRHSTHAAATIHDKLEAAGQHLRHTDRLIGALGAASTDPAHATGVAILSSRAERLTTLVEIAKPLADRARQQLGYAHDALEYGVTSSTEPGRDQLQMFWSLDRGVFDTARELARARNSTRDGAELTEHAIQSGALTGAHARSMLRPHLRPATSPTGDGLSGPTI